MNRLRMWRVEHKLTQAEAAAALGVSQAMVAEVEAGTKPMPSSWAGKLGHAIGRPSNAPSRRGPYHTGQK